MRFLRHLLHRARRIAADEGTLEALRYLGQPRVRWRNWRRYG